MPQDLKIHQPDDRFFKSAMSDPEVVKAYLQQFYPEIFFTFRLYLKVQKIKRRSAR